MNSWVMKRKKIQFWYLFFLVTLLSVRESLPLKQRRPLIIKEDSLIVCRLKQRTSEGSEVKVEIKFLSASVLKICSLPLCREAQTPPPAPPNRLTDFSPVNAEKKYFKIECNYPEPSTTMWSSRSSLHICWLLYSMLWLLFCAWHVETLFVWFQFISVAAQRHCSHWGTRPWHFVFSLIPKIKNRLYY